jgi:hypothetical protein
MKNNQIKIQDYVTILYPNYLDGAKRVYILQPDIIKSNDSITKKIIQHKRRYEYLLYNKLNLDSLRKELPDTIKVSKLFMENLTDVKFQNYFNQILIPNKKTTFSEKELMQVAANFCAPENYNGKYSFRFCIGEKNKPVTDFSNKDLTILEAIVFDALAQYFWETDDDKIKNNYIKKVSEAVENFSNLGASEKNSQIKEYVFNEMIQDVDIKSYLQKFIFENKMNIPIKIKWLTTPINNTGFDA